MTLHQVAVQVKPVYTPPQLFPIGTQVITYIATDRSGNQANCTFTVTVIGESHSSMWKKLIYCRPNEKSCEDTYGTPFTQLTKNTNSENNNKHEKLERKTLL